MPLLTPSVCTTSRNIGQPPTNCIFSLCLWPYPTINYHSIWWNWCLRQHYRQFFRVQYLGKSAITDGCRRGNSNHDDFLGIYRSLLQADYNHHASVPDTLYHRHVNPSRHSILLKQEGRYADCILHFLLLFCGLISLTQFGVPQCRWANKEVHHHCL